MSKPNKIIGGREFFFDGRGYVPADMSIEKDPIYIADKVNLVRFEDLPEIDKIVTVDSIPDNIATLDDIPDNIATLDDIPIVDNFALKAQYTDIYYRADAIYENDYIKLKYIGNTKLYEVKRLTARTSYGDKNVDSKVVFNNGWCYLFSEYLSQSANWELFVIHYDIVNNIRTYPPDLRGKIGRNVMQDEELSNSYHSRIMSLIFKSIHSYFGGNERQVLESRLVEGGSIPQSRTDEVAVKYKCNLFIRPYVGGATSEEVSSAPDILTVASHYGNYFYEGGAHNELSDDESLNIGARRDITPDANTFLKNTIAVSAGINESGTGVWSSYGFGVEFFESFSESEIKARYPEQNIYNVLFGVYVPDERTVITGIEVRADGSHKKHLIEIEDRYVGETLWLYQGSNKIEFQVAEIIDEYTIKSDRDLPIFSSPEGKVRLYVWGYTKLYRIVDTIRPAQSPSCGIVAGKLAVIQDKTDANWQLVREAARMTASNSTMELVNGKKIYTTHWDMKRGFGIIDVDKAVEYIEDNYSNNSDYIDSVIPQLPKYNPLLKLEHLEDNNPVTKKQIIEVKNNWIKNW